MLRPIARHITAVLVVSLALMGCAAPAPSASAGLAEPTTATTPSPTPTELAPSPSATATPSAEPSGPMSVVEGELPAGSYVSTSLGLDISFDLDAGWAGFADIDDVGFALSREGIAGGVTLTTFDGDVFSDPCSSAATEKVEPTAEAFVAWLAAHPELDAAEPAETTLGGRPAIQLDVTSDVGDECPERPRIWLWVLPVVGDFHLDEDEAARFIVADIGGQTVVFVIETFGMTGHEEHLDLAEPILASMVIEP